MRVCMFAVILSALLGTKCCLALSLIGRPIPYLSLLQRPQLPNLNDLFSGFITNTKDRVTDNEIREQLKQRLQEECRSEKGKISDKERRKRVEDVIDELIPYSFTTETASSPLLQKKWMVAYTTEKEINFFVDVGISKEGSIYQTVDGPSLVNMIPFQKVNGGCFSVEGKLSIPDPAGKRTNFEFQSATLDLGKWGSFKLPPVGKGWFDTVFLDESLRIDVNSRDDILICTPMSDWPTQIQKSR